MRAGMLEWLSSAQGVRGGKKAGTSSVSPAIAAGTTRRGRPTSAAESANSRLVATSARDGAREPERGQEPHPARDGAQHRSHRAPRVRARGGGAGLPGMAGEHADRERERRPDADGARQQRRGRERRSRQQRAGPPARRSARRGRWSEKWNAAIENAAVPHCASTNPRVRPTACGPSARRPRRPARSR